jgi:hypothetical protein
METKTYTTLDRAALGWPTGPWDGEPDKVQWPDEATGLPCLAVRHKRLGHWCGYVGVAEGHPWYRVDYDDTGVDVDVHGGLTFAEMCLPDADESRDICHVPAAGEPDHVWWLGFDCAHGRDWSPGDAARAGEEDCPWTRFVVQEYRTLGYVQQQCAKLAAQIKAAEARDD